MKIPGRLLPPGLLIRSLCTLPRRAIGARTVAAALAAQLVLIALHPAIGLADPDLDGERDPARIAARVLDGSYQTELPAPQSPPEPPPVSRIDLPAPLTGGLAAVFHVLGWVLLIAFGALALLTLGRDLNRRRQDQDDAVSAGEPTEAAEMIEFEFPDPEALAAQGRFAEAIHILLLRALTELGRRGKGLVPDSLTSREILRRVHLPPGAGEALGELVRAVEISHFGGADTGRFDYEQCRSTLHNFTRACEEAGR